MKRFLSISILIIIAAILASLYIYNQRQEAARQKVLQDMDAQLAKHSKTYTKPEVGMPFTSFSELCKSEKLIDGDDFQTTQTAAGNRYLVVRKYTPERAKSDCYGRFSFDDGYLISISR